MAVTFLEEEIVLVKRLRELGPPWESAIGKHVWYANNFCKRTSPFQTGAYFVLN